MAEYVRRKRPPASHPYWARLHDRAHPPQVVLPVVIPASVGLGLGLYGGLRPSYSVGEAARLAVAVAGASSAGLFILAVLVLWLDGSRHTPRRERWAGALLGAVFMSAILFVAMFMGTFLTLLWYAVCSGRGPWLGMLIGAGLGGTLAAMVALGNRRRWQERQRRWPRWERMRSPRHRPALTVTSIPAPSLGPAEVIELRSRLGQ
jgi:hypothetical protein